MSRTVEAQISKLRPAPSQKDVRIDDKTVLELELMLAREQAILSNRLLVAKLDDQGAKLRVKVTQIEAELTKRRSNAAGGDATPVTKYKATNKPENTNMKKNNNSDNLLETSTNTTECGGGEHHHHQSPSKLRGRYDECLVQAPNLYSKLKSMSLEDSIFHGSKEGQKEISRTNEGSLLDKNPKHVSFKSPSPKF